VMHWGYLHGWGRGELIASGVMMLLVLGGLAAVIIVAVRWGSRSAASAQRILADRFARGEIDAQQYQHDRDLIGR
jgi:uncharacterized membrane protein